MEKRTLGRTGMRVTALGFGAAEIGFERTPQEDVDRLLNAALDAGLNVIDTAECYRLGDSVSEKKIGNAVSSRRDEFFLFTKCGHAAGFDLPEWDPRMLEQSIDRSLRDLKTDRLDLIQLHNCPEEKLREGTVIDVLRRARDAGKTRFIGASGDGAAARYAVECGAFDTLQTSVNIADQESIDLTLGLAQQREMGVIAKRPIANAAWRTGQKPVSAYHHTYWDRLQQLRYDFLSDGVEHGVSVALRFTLSQSGVATAIVGTGKPDRWKANAALLDAGPLDAAMVSAIRSRWRHVAGPDWVGQT